MPAKTGKEKGKGMMKSKVGVQMKKTAPVAVSAVTRKEKTRPVLIVMREEVSDVTVYAAKFANSPMAINPANEELFPYLSQIAIHFSTYFFKKLKFEYEPNASTGNAGTVAIAVNPNADDKPFEDMKGTLNREGSVQGAPWTALSASGVFPSSRSIGPKFVTDVTGAESLENIFDDLHTIVDGVVNVVTAGLNILGANNLDVTVDGVPLTLNLNQSVTGKLFVDYECELFDPILEEAPDDELYVNGGSTAADEDHPWGTDDTASGNDGLKIAFLEASGTDKNKFVQIIQFPEVGTYMMLAHCSVVVTAGNVFLNDFTDTGDTTLYRTVLPGAPNTVGTLAGDWAAVFEVARAGSTIELIYGQNLATTVPITFGVSKIMIAKVNNSITAIRAAGLSTLSPLDCPKSKGFLVLHHALRQQKAADALLAAHVEVKRLATITKRQHASAPYTISGKPKPVEAKSITSESKMVNINIEKRPLPSMTDVEYLEWQQFQLERVKTRKAGDFSESTGAALIKSASVDKSLTSVGKRMPARTCVFGNTQCRSCSFLGNGGMCDCAMPEKIAAQRNVSFRMPSVRPTTSDKPMKFRIDDGYIEVEPVPTQDTKVKESVIPAAMPKK